MTLSFNLELVAASAFFACAATLIALRFNRWVRHRRQNLDVAASILEEFHACASKLLNDPKTPPELIPLIRSWVAQAGHAHMAAWLESEMRRGRLFTPLEGARKERAKALQHIVNSMSPEGQRALMTCFAGALYSSAYVSLRHADLRLSIVRVMLKSERPKKLVPQNNEKLEQIAVDYAVTHDRTLPHLMTGTAAVPCLV